jgi:hypothetical protein
MTPPNIAHIMPALAPHLGEDRRGNTSSFEASGGEGKSKGEAEGKSKGEAEGKGGRCAGSRIHRLLRSCCRLRFCRRSNRPTSGITIPECRNSRPVRIHPIF